MSVSNIWVLAESAEGAPTSTTLELLSKARQLGTSVTAFVAGDATEIAAALGDFGATRRSTPPAICREPCRALPSPRR